VRVTPQLSQKVAAIRDEILCTLPPALIVREQFKIAIWYLRAPFEHGPNEIVTLARTGDSDARAAIQILLSEHFAQAGTFNELADALIAYCQDQVTGELSSPKGRPRLRHWARDFWIFAAMWICEERGLRPTRTALKRQGAIESGSQLVESILRDAGINKISVPQIEKIYRSRRAKRSRMTP
jgi:hypothetical protein